MVVDLDNTLWNGILGDDGINQLEISEGDHGNAFERFQQAVCALGKQGVILAINSKNNADLVKECFAKRSMPLKYDDFALVVANWQPKNENLQNIVRTLNIGEDSLVFVDDSSFECNLVRETMPKIHVLERSEEPANAVDLLLQKGLFDRASITKDDQMRNQQYAIEAQREKLRTSTNNYDEYLQTLELSVSMQQIEANDKQRASQLSQRTNQFNLSGFRLTEGDLENRLKHNQNNNKDCNKDNDQNNNKNNNKNYYLDYLFKVQDRFGDYGIVGAIYAHHFEDVIFIENIILSCRVFSRGVENQMMADFARLSKKMACKQILATFIESSKNQAYSTFYQQNGFVSILFDELDHRFKNKFNHQLNNQFNHQTSFWKLDLSDESKIPKSPNWINQHFARHSREGGNPEKG